MRSHDRQGVSTATLAFWLGSLALMPASLVCLDVAFRFPDRTERIYGEWLYPRVAAALGRLNGLAPFSLAEAVGLTVLLATVGYCVLAKRRARRRSKLASALKAATILWIFAGFTSLWFIVSWGFNYARPSLEKRMGLSTQEIDIDELLDAGRRSARRATELHAALGQPPDEPTQLNLGFAPLNEVIERRMRELRLPGDRLTGATSPAKKLWGSTLLSYLGLSGVFVPFTGEPSINAKVPDASLPIVVAHERAHQRGITNEGEANLVAFMACAKAHEQPYLPYAAYLYASARLLQAASRESPEEAREPWGELGPGPRRDLEAIREFWSHYQGPAAVAADRVNDFYLRSVRVQEGARSYQRIVRLLIALDRRGEL